MFAQIRNSLTQSADFTSSELDLFCAKLVVRKLKYREFLFEAGQVCKAVAFINKGCLRYYYLAEGEEHTLQFFFEHAWYTDYESFLTEQPTTQFVQALEPTELFLLSKSDLTALYNTTPKFERFGRIMAEQAYLGSRKNNVAYHTLSPEERYLKLVHKRPKVIQRIALKYIASHLGIQPESLSRIRKRLFDEKENS